MNIKRLVLFGVAILATAGVAAVSANLSFSTGASFIPGYRTVDGSDLNQIVTAVNTLTAQNGGDASPSVPAGAVNGVSLSASLTGIEPNITVGSLPGKTGDANIGIVLSGLGTGSACLGGTTCANSNFEATTVASAVNHVTVTAGATGTLPLVTSGGAGADANIGLLIDASGTGSVYLSGTTAANSTLIVPGTTSSVNPITITSAATGSAPSIAVSAAGADTNTSLQMTAKGTGRVLLGAITTCSGTTTATCAVSQRFVASVTGLTTAAGGTSSAAMTVTDTTVSSSAVPVVCSVNGYSGTGQPIVTNVTPGTGTVSFQVTNIAASGVLNATVPVACIVG